MYVNQAEAGGCGGLLWPDPKEAESKMVGARDRAEAGAPDHAGSFDGRGVSE